MDSTDVITTIDGVPCRVWHGTAAHDIPVKVFVRYVVARDEDDNTRLETELQSMPTPKEMRMRDALSMSWL